MAQINREGSVSFGDASFSIWEEPAGKAMIGGDWAHLQAPSFARIIQQLNRLGWTVGPWKNAANCAAIANNHRSCNKDPSAASWR